MNPYVPILFFFALGLAFAVVSVLGFKLLGPKRYNAIKLQAYECGIQPTPQPVGGGRFPVKYYITAMMFLVFDVEIAFLYPWVVAFDQLSMFAVLSMIVFLLLLCIAYYYEYKRGGMEWD